MEKSTLHKDGVCLMRQSKTIASCGMAAALSVVVMIIGGILGLGMYASPMIAGFLLPPIGKKFGAKYEWTLWGAVSLLCFILVPNAEQNLMYLCFFGLYPLLYPHFEKLKGYLSALGIGYEIDARIVRGLDYYTKTVFEIITDSPDGTPLTVCGGGRYDGLVEELGGPATPGIGFGMGVERMIMVQDMRGTAPEPPVQLDALVVTMGDEARLEGVKLVSQLREKGVRADLDHAARSMKAQFKYAGKLGVKNVIVIAGDELAKGVVKLRDMDASSEVDVAKDEIVAMLAGK